MSLPLSLIGVALALHVTRDTLNMMSLIGIILPMGLVAKNAILLMGEGADFRSARASGDCVHAASRCPWQRPRS